MIKGAICLLRLFYLRFAALIGLFWLILVAGFVLKGWLSSRNSGPADLQFFVWLSGLFSIYLASRTFEDLMDPLSAVGALTIPFQPIGQYFIRTLVSLMIVPAITGTILMLVASFLRWMGVQVVIGQLGLGHALGYTLLHSFFLAGSISFRSSHFFLTCVAVLGGLIGGVVITFASLYGAVGKLMAAGGDFFSALLFFRGTQISESLPAILNSWGVFLALGFYCFGYFKYREFEGR